MSYDTLVAKTPSIIYRPGGVAGGLVVTTWAEVQAFIAFRQGNVIIYVDDSVAAAHVPAASGITDCQNRVELRAYRQSFITFAKLIIDSGAQLKNLWRVTGALAVLADTQGATPGFDWDYTLGTPIFFVADTASIGTTTTATTPAIIVPAAQELFIQFEDTAGPFVQSASALVNLAAASSTIQMFFYAAEILGPGFGAMPATWITGPGTSILNYDTPTLPMSPGGAPPSSAATQFSVDLDGTSMGAVIYRPGVPTSGMFVETWGEVANAVRFSNGAIVVYIDDAVAAAHVPAAAGVTDFQGRGSIRPFRQNVETFSTLTVDSGATLKSLVSADGTIFLVGDTTGATPAFDWDYTGPAIPTFYLRDNAFIGNTPAATSPSIVVPAASQLNIQVEDGGGIFSQTAATFVVHLAAATSILGIVGHAAEFSGTAAPANIANGAGTVNYAVDSATLGISTNPPPVFTVGTLIQIQLDTHVVEMTFLASATNVLAAFQASQTLPTSGAIAALPTTGTLRVAIEGFGGTGGGGGGEGGGASVGVGGGGSGGAQYQSGSFDFDLSHRLDINVGTAGTPGAAGAAGNGAGGTGGDGGASSALDFTTATTMFALSGSSGGQGGGPGVGRGGASYPGGVFIPSISDLAGPPYGSGFMLAGGKGGLSGTSGTAGQRGIAASLIAGGGTFFAPGAGGVSVAGDGGGGGGGGAGVFAAGGAGGAGAPAGSPGGAGVGSAANSGAGVGGGAGGAGAGDAGGPGATGVTGRVRVSFIAN